MVSASPASTGSGGLSVPPGGELDSTGHPAPRPHGIPWGRCTEAVIDRTLHSATGSPRTTGLRRPAAGFLLVVGLIGGGLATAADWGAGSSYSPGGSGQAGDPYGRQKGTGGGYRPTEGSSAPWQAPAGTGSASSWPPTPASGQGEGSAWNGQSQGYRGQSATGQPDRPFTDYRFRQRPEDKTKKTDDAPRYRPDPELARRSQQFWGVPGQDPSAYGGGPGVVFRPLHPEQEQSGKGTTGKYRGDPVQPPPASYPGAPAYGYGYGYGYPY